MVTNYINYCGREYFFSLSGDYIVLVTDTGTRYPVKVRACKDYTVKWNEKSKTFSSIGGAAGLFRFLSENTELHNLFWIYTESAIKKILCKCKPM